MRDPPFPRLPTRRRRCAYLDLPGGERRRSLDLIFSYTLTHTLAHTLTHSHTHRLTSLAHSHFFGALYSSSGPLSRHENEEEEEEDAVDREADNVAE